MNSFTYFNSFLFILKLPQRKGNIAVSNSIVLKFYELSYLLLKGYNHILRRKYGPKLPSRQENRTSPKSRKVSQGGLGQPQLHKESIPGTDVSPHHCK